MPASPRAFSHVGLSVPDLEAAVEFYTGVLGFQLIVEPAEVVENDSDGGRMATDVFGPGWARLRVAHLSTADQVGIELFEFDGNHAPEDNLSFRRHGTFHFAVHAPDLEDLLARIVAAGGKQRMPVREYLPGDKPYRMCYVEDPFGTVFELYSHGYELICTVGAPDR